MTDGVTDTVVVPEALVVGRILVSTEQ